MFVKVIVSLSFLIVTHFFIQVAAADSATSVPTEVQSAVKAREWIDIKPNLNDIDRWINADPREACDYFIPLARGGNATADVFLKRIAEKHHGDKKVSVVLIPYFLGKDFDFSREYVNGFGLLMFCEDDYTTATKQWIHDSLRRNPSPKLFLACGAANMKQEIPFLKEIVTGADPQNEWIQNKWAFFARLACARMGDDEQIKYVIDHINTLRLSKSKIYIAELHMLGYTRQPAAIKYLEIILNGDERMSPVRLHDVGEPWSRVALDVLTKCLEDFPIQWVSGRGYSDHDVAIARNWMKSQKELKIVR